eukprot:CAMPEP_0202473838 /NCGR_PEP_ID=MMETSP1360-20130828/92055_1 /ASSEMBLY_ACC=CAM_ASM_000848 /TAXON_ID=515479 /ORGANISM="Licmophora paradoxa, Strain CCMP2313" /LENGTH=228 /DNA_ID=CAMNT_0049100911 /DNA_START=11 /DNA_END=697 /DNA_ORIENTATION=-
MTVKEALAKVAAMEAEEESFDVTTSLAVTTDTPTKPPPVAVMEEEKPITQKPVAKTPVVVVPPPAPVPVPAPPVVVAATPTKKPARTQQLKLLIPNPVTQMPSTTKDSTKNVEENIAAARREVASTLAQVREAQSRMPQSSGLLTTNNGKRKKIDATPASATIDENAKENSLPIATPENSVAETPLFTSSTAKAKTTNPFLAMLKYIFRSLFKILTFWRRGGDKSTTA